MMTAEEADQENARIATAEKVGHDKRVLSLLNQLPINCSAKQLISEKYDKIAPNDGLYLIRLLVCLAVEEVDVGEGDPVYWDLQRILKMTANDAVDFMFNLNEEIGVESDADDFVNSGDFKSQVMFIVYRCLPSNVCECMQAIGARGVYDD